MWRKLRKQIAVERELTEAADEVFVKGARSLDAAFSGRVFAGVQT